MRIFGLLPVVFLATVGCGQSKPDCGSTEGQKLVSQIAKDNKAMVSFLRTNGSGPDNPDTSGYTDPEIVKMETDLENTKNKLSELQQDCLKHVPDGDDFNKNFCTDPRWDARYEGNPASDYREKNLTPLFREIPRMEMTLGEKKVKIKYKKFDDLLPGIKYTLSNMILTNKDESTGSVECKATLEAELADWGTAGQDITYKIEKTTEGKLMATVFGI